MQTQTQINSKTIRNTSGIEFANYLSISTVPAFRFRPNAHQKHEYDLSGQKSSQFQKDDFGAQAPSACGPSSDGPGAFPFTPDRPHKNSNIKN